MHNASPVTPINNWWTVLKEFDALIYWEWYLILRWTLKSIFAHFEDQLLKDLETSQRLKVSRKSWRVFQNRLLLGRCFQGFILPILEYCSAMWCLTADTHHKLLYHLVSGGHFLTGGVFACDIARRSVAVLCMLYMIKCNQMHPLYGVLHVLYVPVQVICSALVALMRLLTAKPSTTYCRTCIPISVSLWNALVHPVFDSVRLEHFFFKRAGPMLFYWPKLLYLFLFSIIFSFLF